MNPVAATLLKLVLLLAPLVLLARFARIYPTRRLALLALIPAVASCAMAIAPEAFMPMLILDPLFVAVAIVDLFLLPRSKWIEAERTTQRAASLGVKHRVEIRLRNRSTRTIKLDLRDDLPEEFEADPAEFELMLPPRSRNDLHYQATARRRGRYTLARLYLRTVSRLGLWQRYWTVGCASEVHVYPDMRQLEQYAVLARKNRLNLLGVRRSRRIGQDNEFERLRDYTLDDNFRHIDWRATARRQRLIVRDFQQNQSQRVVFLVDCGRMMTNFAPSGARQPKPPAATDEHAGEGLTFLDHALNAMLMMSYVALTRGDAVGLLTFSDEIHSYLPPRSGMSQMNRLLHASFDRFPRMVESRYDLPFAYLATHLRKRSLVVLLTNVIDEVNAEALRQHLTHVAGRHLPLGVLLRDRVLFDAVADAEQSDAALYRGAAAAGILSWRHEVLADLHASGSLVLDVFPDELTAPLVNRYLEIKARHLL